MKAVALEAVPAPHGCRRVSRGACSHSLWCIVNLQRTNSRHFAVTNTIFALESSTK
jgi:hypothetical protein